MNIDNVCNTCRICKFCKICDVCGTDSSSLSPEDKLKILDRAYPKSEESIRDKEYEERRYGPAKRTVSAKEVYARAKYSPGFTVGYNYGLLNYNGEHINQHFDDLRIKMERE